MNVTLISGNGVRNITEYITSQTISGEYRSCCRTADFGIIQSSTDSNIEAITLELGDNIQISQGGEVIFYGLVWDRSKTTDGNEIDIACKDYGIYLTKNKASYSFDKLTPEVITAKVCSDYGIEVGSLAATGVPITRKFLGVSLYDIIMTSYSLANDKKYICVFEGNKLNVLEKGIRHANALRSGENLLTSSVSESLSQMVNRVNIYSDKDMLINTVEDKNNVKLYGLMSEYIKASSDKENYNLKASKMLKGVDQKISVTNFGDISYITGSSVMVTELDTGLKGRFYIDQDQHNWKNGIYTNRLVLNFENLMDEKESGSNG